jgi:hypothetical protein
MYQLTSGDGDVVVGKKLCMYESVATFLCVHKSQILNLHSCPFKNGKYKMHLSYTSLGNGMTLYLESLFIWIILCNVVVPHPDKPVRVLVLVVETVGSRDQYPEH